MANQTLKNLATMFSDVKTRTIILLTAGVLLVAVIVGVIGIKRSASNATTGGANLAAAPQVNRGGTPQITQERVELTEGLNVQRRGVAEQSGQSFIPSVLPTLTEQPDDSFGLTGGTAGGAGGTGGGLSDRINNPLDPTAGQQAGQNNVAQQLADQQAEFLKQQQSEQEKYFQQQQDQLALRQSQEEQQAKVESMQQEAKALLSSWNSTPAQQYVASAKENAKDAAAQLNGNNQDLADKLRERTGPEKPPVYKAGDILFAVLNTEINSDEKGPILATVVTGPLKGSKLVGTIQEGKKLQGTNGATALVLNFNLMNVPEQPKSIGINAVAIDPDTARTALASKVDHHYLLRYGSLFASSFMEGYGQAITEAGSVKFDLGTGGEISAKDKLDPREEIAAGFGKVGQKWGQQMDEIFDRPNTVIIHSGISLGILLLSDVSY